MTVTLEQLITFAVVVGAALGAMIYGYSRGEKDRLAQTQAHPLLSFNGPAMEIIRLLKEQNRLLLDILDVMAPRRPGGMHDH